MQSEVSDGGPYRSTCSVCEARAKAEKQITPFQKPGYRQCPECQAYDQTSWTTICTGGTKLILKEGWKGFWFFRWWGRVEEVSFSCELEHAPKHLHYHCRTCDHHWMMLTATEGSGYGKKA